MPARPRKNSKKNNKKLAVKTKAILAAIAFVVLLLVGGLTWFLIRSQLIEKSKRFVVNGYEGIMNSGAKYFGLTLQNIYLDGQKFTPEDKIEEVLQLQKNHPILTVPIAEIKQKLETLDWVDHVNIERHIPNTLHIRITEKAPVAIWQINGELSLIDKKGKVISADHISNFLHLPVVVGHGANENIAGLLEIISEEKKIYQQVKSLIWVGKRRWNVRFKNDIEILLPEENYDKAWQYLLALDKEKKILSRDVKSIDLRLPDRVFIK